MPTKKKVCKACETKGARIAELLAEIDELKKSQASLYEKDVISELHIETLEEGILTIAKNKAKEYLERVRKDAANTPESKKKSVVITYNLTNNEVEKHESVIE